MPGEIDLNMVAGCSPEHAAAIENMKNQLLIVLIGRLGGKVDIPLTEIDATGDRILSMRLNTDTRSFEFAISKKH